MAVAVLKLDLAPPSTFWRTHHPALGWAALALGVLILAGAAALTVQGYRSAAASGRQIGSVTAQTGARADAQAKILADLRGVDVAKELPRWRLAERIYTERSLPWSRLTAELERSLVQDVRISAIQRNRGADLKVQIKLKGEARSREAEAAFVESLQKNPFFEQVILEREGERQGGGVEFNYVLAVTSNPPPYHPLPKYGPAPKAAAAKAAPAVGHAPAAPARSGVAVPAPAPAPAPPMHADPHGAMDFHPPPRHGFPGRHPGNLEDEQ